MAPGLLNYGYTIQRGIIMSKFLALVTLLIVSVAPSVHAWDFEYQPDRPDRPSRPGQGPGRPGQGPGRPGQGPIWPERPPVQQIVFQVVDKFQVQKVIETTNTIRVNHPNVKALRLIARGNSVEIIEARALLDNGREVYMDGITGGLGRDRGFTYTFDGPRGQRVRSITLRAVTRNLVGSRADLEVAVGVFQ